MGKLNNWAISPLLLLILNCLNLFPVSSSSSEWGENLKELSTTDYLLEKRESAQRFLGNQTHVDFFKLLRQDGESLLIGARNVVYNISLRDLTENLDQRITWNPTEVDRSLCQLKGKSRDECQNYIRVLAKTELRKRLLVCGTNAYNPLCRQYEHNETDSSYVEQFSGKGFCPYDPRHNSTALYTGGELYSGTVADFSATDSLIIKGQLRTEQYDYKHLNSPNFVSSMEDEDHVYFFFRESAVEYINCGKSVYSRVARVCKNDQGGVHNKQFKHRWTTFLKARLNCSVPGEMPFYFDEIQATSRLIPTDDDDDDDDAIFYGVFNTPENSIAGSAVCKFRMSDVKKVFEEGPFKNQENVNANWLPMSKGQVPTPRPGLCQADDDDEDPSESSLHFIRRHSLVDWAVPNADQKGPVFIRTSFNERLSVIAVDSKVEIISDGEQPRHLDVLFIGTSKGRVLKVYQQQQQSPVLVESMQVFPADIAVKNVLLANYEDGKKLVVISDHEVLSVPLQRCSSSEAPHSCSSCLALRDPYCAWNTLESKCVDQSRYEKDEKWFLWQELRTGAKKECQVEDNKIKGEASSTTATTTTTTSATSALIPLKEERGNDDSDRHHHHLGNCSCECSTEKATIIEPIYEVPTEPVGVNLVLEEDRGDRLTDDGDANANGDVVDVGTPIFQPIESAYDFVVEQGLVDLPKYSERTLALTAFLTALLALSAGFVFGFYFAKRFEDKKHKGDKKKNDVIFVSTSDLFNVEQNGGGHNINKVHPNNKLTFHHNPRLLTATPSTESSTFSTNSRQSNGTPTNSMINHEGDESNAGHHDHQNTPPRLRNHALKMKFLADLATEAETMRENNPQNCHSNYSTFKGGLENYTSFKTFYPDQKRNNIQQRYSVPEISSQAPPSSSSPDSSMSSSSVPLILSPPGEFRTLQTGEWTLTAPRQQQHQQQQNYNNLDISTGLYHTLRFPDSSKGGSSGGERRSSESTDSLQRVKRVYL